MKYLIYTLLLIIPFIFIGVINKIKAIWAGKKGSSLIQPLWDVIKLLKKGEVISKTTTFVFKLSPVVNIASILIGFLLLPIPGFGSVISFQGDLIVFAYVLGFAKFMTVIAALDTGSSFEGMGASREVTLSTIVEPAFFIFLGTLALLTNQFSFESIFLILEASSGFNILIKILFLIILLIMLLVEGSRVPIDDPNTHLELTMIHEVMVLDYSGPDLAFIFYSAAMKMVLISILIANIIIPSGLSIAVTTVIFFSILFLIALFVGIIESLIARMRLTHIPQFIFFMTSLSLTAFAVVLFFLFGGF